MQCIVSVENNPPARESHVAAAQMRALRREARRVHAGARASVARLNALAARVESDIDAILRGGAIA